MNRMINSMGLCALIALLWLLTACADAPPQDGRTVDIVAATVTVPAAVVEYAAPTARPTNTPRPTWTPTPVVQATATPTPTTDPAAQLQSRPRDINPLTGLQVDDPSKLRRRPLMVRIGNDFAARPQVALNEADMVYEEITEWWITRFTAIYLSNDPPVIAPIRSARLINLLLTPQYQAALANSGGSDPVRWELSQIDIVNLDEFFTPQPYFYREGEGWQTRLALDAQAARDFMDDEGLEARVQLRGFAFSEELTLDFPAAADVVIPYPSSSRTRWVYNAATEEYRRYINGNLLLTFSGEEVRANNVILYFAEHQETDIVEDSNGATSVRILLNGEGPAWVLRDGKLLKGRWQTDGEQTPLFTFENGELLPLKPGNSWVQVVPLDYEIEIDGQTHTLTSAPDGAAMPAAVE